MKTDDEQLKRDVQVFGQLLRNKLELLALCLEDEIPTAEVTADLRETAHDVQLHLGNMIGVDPAKLWPFQGPWPAWIDPKTMYRRYPGVTVTRGRRKTHPEPDHVAEQEGGAQ